MEVIKSHLNSTSKKVSFAIYCVVGLIMFIYFIFDCIQANSAQHTPSFRIWMQNQPSLSFPQFTVCPEYNEGAILYLQCWILQPKSLGGNIVIPSSGSVTTSDGRQCTKFNTDVHIQNVGQGELWCEANATNGWVGLDGNIQFFFADQGVNNYQDAECGECILGQDNYVADWRSFTYINIEKKVYITNGTNVRYQANGYSYPYPTYYNGTHNIDVLFGYSSLDVWYYQLHNYYNFWQWMGYLGGAAFLFKMIHDAIMGSLNATIFKDSNEQYTTIK